MPPIPENAAYCAKCNNMPCQRLPQCGGTDREEEPRTSFLHTYQVQSYLKELVEESIGVVVVCGVKAFESESCKEMKTLLNEYRRGGESSKQHIATSLQQLPVRRLSGRQW